MQNVETCCYIKRLQATVVQIDEIVRKQELFSALVEEPCSIYLFIYFFTIGCVSIRGALVCIRTHAWQVIVKQICQIIVRLLDQRVVEGDVSAVVLPQQELQQGRSLILPGGLETKRDIGSCYRPYRGLQSSIIMHIKLDTVFKQWEAHLRPDLLLLIHRQHTVADHVIHQVGGLDILLQLVAKAQQGAPRSFLQRHLCTGRQPCGIPVRYKLKGGES